jgi:glycosyltransferase involved in cell wall biosynthesis
VSVGLVHDYLLSMRGAERAFSAIAGCWPGAPIYTLLYDSTATNHRFAGRAIRASYLQRLPLLRNGRHRALLPAFPRAIERLPVRQHDIVISSSSAFAHGVRTAPSATHICYCYTPFRYAWREKARAVEAAPFYLRRSLSRTLERIQRWDLAASRGVTQYLAISEASQQLIGAFYERQATVVYPPVEVERFKRGTPEDFFLVVGQLVRHKRIEIALEAAKRARKPIRVVGDGPDRRRLVALYDGNAEFLGRIPDHELAELYSRARAVIVPSVEEFGIVAVEAQAAGRPVVAPGLGGTTETVVDGETGVLVPAEDTDAFAEALGETDFDRFSPERLRVQAERFSVNVFRERFTAEVQRLTGLPAAHPQPRMEAAAPR